MNVIRDDLLLRIRIRVVTNEAVVEIRIGALEETDIRTIILRETFAVNLPTPVPTRNVITRRITKTVSCPITRFAVVRIEEEVARRGSQRLETHGGLFVETKASIESQHLIVLIDKVVTRSNHADRVFLTNVALQSQHTDVCVLVDETFTVANNTWIESTLVATSLQVAAIVGAQFSLSIATPDHQAKRVAAHFSSCLHRHIRIDNRARVNGSNRRLKNVDAFEKERTFLRKEDRKTLVRGDNKLIRFDLGKVRIDCQINCDRRTWNKFRSHTDIETHGALH